jgi:ABC-2 type transport system permease protein
MNGLISVELIKLRTMRSPWLLLATAAAAVLIGAAGYLTSNGLTAAETPARAVGHAGLVALFPLVLGIMAVAGEHRHRTITDTYLSTPGRARVLATKTAVYTLMGLGFGIVAAAVASAEIGIWYAANGSTLHLDSEFWRTAAGAVGWNAAFAAIGVALGALLRNLAGAIAAALVWIAVIEGLVGQLLGDAKQWLPFAAATALGRAPMGLSGLSQWTALAVLVGYAGLLGALATALTVRRDVA